MERYLRKRSGSPVSRGAPGPRRKAARLPWVSCPECGRRVVESALVEHMTGRSCAVAREPAPPPPAPSGHATYEGFVSAAEEAALVAALDAMAPPWKPGTFNGPAHRKKWGVQTDLARRRFEPPATPMPDEFRPLVDRMRAQCAELADFRPNEANALDYRRSEGHYLGAHCDDRQLSGEILVNLSLAGDAVMTYTLDKKRKADAKAKTRAAPPPETFRALLRRRSLQVQ